MTHQGTAMPTHADRILTALRGEQADRLPYVPRLDLWYLANAVAGTLPPQHRGRSRDEIARAEGWALHHKYADDLLGEDHGEEYLHRGIGLYRTRDCLVDFVLPGDVEVEVERDGSLTRVRYHTPLGTVSNTVQYTARMQRNGVSIPLHTEHLIKSPEDYPAVGHLFQHMDAVPNPARFERWRDEELGDDGVPVVFGFHAASPIQQIQRDLIDATGFFFHYRDHEKAMRRLAEQMTPLFERVLQLHAESAAPVVQWGANFDDMLTYAPYFERDIMPWIRHAAEVLGARGKLVLCHTDGENLGLMDLIRDSGMHVAESICPAPMTKVPLAEYYRRWSDRLTLFGGIPSTLLLADSTSDEAFEAYLDELFRVVAPGTRMVVGIADQVPPQADFDRLVRIGERIEREGRLPLEAGGFRPVSAAEAGERAPVEAAGAPAAFPDAAYESVRADVLDGDDEAIVGHVLELVEQGHPAQDVLDRGLIAAMEVIGGQFATGEAFIPEVLLSSRAMNAAVDALAPYLASDREARGRVLMGTVQGDMHNIGKNMVVTMLKGAGFEVLDLGINVPTADFVEMVAEYKPHILGLSALLTTTMTEMEGVLEALQTSALRDRVKVIVGGAPVSQAFAEDIGADGYAADAVSAVALARRLAAPAG